MTDAAFRATTTSTPAATGRDADDEAIISALEHAPTGAPMTGRDHALLAVLGIVLPVLLLIWGWA